MERQNGSFGGWDFWGFFLVLQTIRSGVWRHMDPSYLARLVERPLTEADLPYVAKTWIRTRPTWSRGIPGHVWQNACAGRVERVVRCFGGTGLVDPGHPDWLLGFRVSDQGRLWFVYVKASQRRLGLCTRLLAYSHWQETPWPTRDGFCVPEFPRVVNPIPFFEV